MLSTAVPVQYFPYRTMGDVQYASTEKSLLRIDSRQPSYLHTSMLEVLPPPLRAISPTRGVR